MLHPTAQQEALSRAYLSGLVARAGFTAAKPDPDVDGVDLHIGAGGAMRPSLDFQLKATVTLGKPQDGAFHFPLEVRNYNLLVLPCKTPRLLAVFDMPREPNEWLESTMEQLLLRRAMYWCNLAGEPESQNTSSVTVIIPCRNLLNVTSLHDLMEQSRGGDALMKLKIQDAGALRAITPQALGAFARASGWRPAGTYRQHSDIYTAEDKPEILVPRTERLGDYTAVVAELLEIFARALDQDILAIYRAVLGSDHDVIRVRSFGGKNDGSVSIDAGVELVSQTRQLVLAAACAVDTPQPLYRAGANQEATAYLRRVRLGQTEQGSFVVTLLSPVPPSLGQPDLFPDLDDTPLDPYERRVTRRLVTALEAARNAVEQAASGHGGEAFENAIHQGVSANLCEALATLAEQSEGLDISLSWALTRPRQEPLRKISFTAPDAGILREAGRQLRDRTPKPDVELTGYVKTLKRDQQQVEGLITLKAPIDGRIQAITAVLDQTNYSIAIRAHEAKLPVIMKGDLGRFGQRWQLNNAVVTAVQAEEDEDEDMPE